MTREVQPFTPRSDQGAAVSMYVCGVTVYDYSHIGHARVYVAFDLLYRLLRQRGYNVDYVRNFTDIDDKIIKRAAESGEDPLALSRRFIEEFHTDMAALGCLQPTREPKATDHVEDMVATIQRIINNGHAYAVDGDVFFDAQSIDGYGRLSRHNLDASEEGAGGRVQHGGHKRHHADFALWKGAKEGEPSWDSPWGPGRPGWHIECSSMIRTLMGPVIDIHGGGSDLMFPHHENELAQSQAAGCQCGDKGHMHQGTDFVRYWVHNGFVNVDNEKMSKSVGNFFTIRTVLQEFHPMALRWFLIGTQYRQPLNYTLPALQEATDRLYYICETLQNASEVLSEQGYSLPSLDACRNAAEPSLVQSVQGSLLDDLNTPQAIAALSEPLRAMNDLLFTKKGRKDQQRCAKLIKGHCLLAWALDLLGMQVMPPSSVLDSMRQLMLRRAGFSEADVQQAIASRADARKAKDFKKADRIRDEYMAKGIAFRDTPQGTDWCPAGGASTD